MQSHRCVRCSAMSHRQCASGITVARPALHRTRRRSLFFFENKVEQSRIKMNKVEHKTSSESIRIYENLSESTGMQSYQWHQHWLFIYAFLTQPFSEVQFKPVVDSTCFKPGSFLQTHSWQKIEARANQSLQQGRSLMKRCGLSRHTEVFFVEMGDYRSDSTYLWTLGRLLQALWVDWWAARKRCCWES